MTNQEDKVVINVNFDENQQLVEVDETKTNVKNQGLLESIESIISGIWSNLPVGKAINASVELNGDLDQIIKTLKSQNPGVNSPAINEIARTLQLGEEGAESGVKAIYKSLTPNDTIATPEIDAMLELAVEYGDYGEEGAITTLRIREPEIERKHNVEIEINEFDSNYKEALKSYKEIVGFNEDDEVIVGDSENDMSLILNRDEIIYDSGNQTIIRSDEEIARQLAVDLLTGNIFSNQTQIPDKILVNSNTYTVKPGDSIFKISQDLGITTQQLIDSNPYLTKDNRISEDGKFILIKEGEKLSVHIKDIKNSIKIDNGAISLDNDNISDNSNNNQGEQGNIYNKDLLTDLLLNQNNDSLFLNLKDDFNDDGNSWQSIEDIKNKDIKLEFDFDTNFKKVNGLDDTYDNPLNVNNDSLKLTINTDKTQDFLPTNNNQLGQDGLVIGDADWGAFVPFINDDGYNNTVPGGILSDDYSPGNSLLSFSEDFIKSLNLNIDNLEGSQRDIVDRNNNGIQVPHIELGNPVADLTNQSIDARNFVNIDPVILDLNNNDKIDLISYQNSEVTFDVDNDNKQERTGWVKGSEGILVHDKNADGQINDITETISEYYSLTDEEWQKYSQDSNKFQRDITTNKYSNHGIEALEKLDFNNDNKFDNQDEFWHKLKIWQDLNEDGITDENELKTLDEAGIKEFDLSQIIEIDKTRNEGNVILAQTSFTTIYNQTRLVQAVDFTTNPIGYEFNDVNLGQLAEAEEGTKSLTIHKEEGQNIDLRQINDENSEEFDEELAGISNVFGGVGDDVIIGDDKNNWLSGGDGSDILQAGAGDDILIIDENDKQENIDGGAGRDIAIINSDEGVALNLNKVNVETAIGGNGDDILISGGSSNVFVDGGNGDDVIIGGAADDALSGSNGQDYIDGAYGNDVIRGHRDEDSLFGGKGDDLIDGGLDDDKLYGGEGKDILIGGRGNDEIDGGEGYDLAKYNGKYEQYQIYKDKITENDEEIDVIKVKNLETQDIDILRNIEGIRFDNVTIKIEENSAPLAVSDKILVEAGLEEYFINKEDLLANDVDLEKDLIDIRVVENAVGGEAEIVKDDAGNIIGVKFTPDQNYSGVMSFDYSVVDDKGKYAKITQNNNDGTSQTADHKARVQFKLSDDPVDPLYYDQWYLSEINIKDVWQDYSGKGVKIGVFEEGDFNYKHQDLDDNILQSHKQDQEFRQVEAFSQHATTVAGVIAAEKNDYGIIGVAYDAELDGYSWNADESGLVNLKDVDVANNSWGASVKFGDNFQDPENLYFNYSRLLEESVKEGRGSLGTINVFAGGNQRQEGDNVNYHNLQNSRFVITTGSINQTGDLGALIEASEPFSNPGSAILVSAPGSNIETTGNALVNKNGSEFLGEFSSNQGTSFSAPIVSGIIALMLEANSNLGYRDVQKILALSAKKFDDPNTIWLENGADNFNGGAMHYSEDYGFGLVDAKAAVRLAESWNEVNNYYNESFLEASQILNGEFNDNDKSSSSFTISDSNLHNIENVEVNIDLLHDDISELKIVLISPSGTKSLLLANPNGELGYENGLNFTFSSRHFLGEKVDGEWKLEIFDEKEGNIGVLKDWSLKIYGKLDDGKDDVYFYNNEINNVENSSRLILRDNDGGIDMINAVAVDGDNIINLNSGEISVLNGQEISIASNQFNDEYYQKQDQLELKQQELSLKEDELAQKKEIVEQKQAQLDDLPEKITTKGQEIDVKDSQFQSALNDFNESNSWFDNIEYVSGIQYSTTHIVYTFRYKDSGRTFQIRKRDYEVRVSDNEANYNRAVSLQNEFNQLIDEYNTLINQQYLLPTEIINAKNDAQESYDEAEQLKKDIAFINDFITSFNDANNTIIEGAYSGDGNDKLIGNDQDNELMAGRGENELIGAAGKDIFVIKKGAVSDIISDFKIGEDRIDLGEFETDFNNLNITQIGADSVIKFESGQEIILKNIHLQDISEQDFKFSEIDLGSDDNDNIIGTNLDDEIDGKGGDDVINGVGGDDIIYGGAGDDLIHGGKGDDEIFDGSGKDVVYGGDGNDIIHIEGGNSPNVYINSAFSQIDSGFFGGRGDDIFKISKLASSSGFLNNLIHDFEVNNKNEKVDLSDFKEINDISDLNLGNISINGQQYLRVTIPNGDDIFSGTDFTLKNITRDQLSNDNFIFDKNDAPIINNDNFELNEDSQIEIPISQILQNDIDAENDEIFFDKVKTNPKNGTVKISEDGLKIIYTPNPNYNGDDNFEYQIIDENGAISSGQVELIINPVEDPIDINDNFEYNNVIGYNDNFEIDLSSLVDNIDGLVLEYDILPKNGDEIPNWLNFDKENLKIYGKAPAQFSDFSFQIEITDGLGQSPALNKVFYIIAQENEFQQIIQGSKFNDIIDIFDDENGYIIKTGDGHDSVNGMVINSTIDLGSGNDIVFAHDNNVITTGQGEDVIALQANNDGTVNYVTDFDVDNDVLSLQRNIKENDFSDLEINDIANGVEIIYNPLFADDSEILTSNKIILQNVKKEDLSANNFEIYNYINSSVNLNDIKNDKINNIKVTSNGSKIILGDKGDIISSSFHRSFDLGAGDDYLSIAESYDTENVISEEFFEVNAGLGDDSIFISSYFTKDIAKYKIDAAQGDDFLYLMVDNSEINGGSGNDKITLIESNNNIISGGEGNDKFQTTERSKANIITDFEVNNFQERIDLLSYYNIQFSDLKFLQSDNDAIIEISDEKILTLKNVQAKELSENNFIFKIAKEGDNIFHAKYQNSRNDIELDDGSNKIIINKSPNSYVNIRNFGVDDVIELRGFNNEFKSFADLVLTLNPKNYEYGQDYISINLGPNQFIRLSSYFKPEELNQIGENNFAFIDYDYKSYSDLNVPSIISIFMSKENYTDIQEQKFLYLKEQDVQIEANYYENNYISANILGNVINGGIKSDIINAIGGNDKIYSKAGNDIIFAGSGNDYVEAGEGDDIIDAGSGFDEVHAGAGDDYVHSVNGRNKFYGEAGNDKLRGGIHQDTIYGGADNDIIFGNGDSDLLYGDAGDDIIYGGVGNDLIDGGEGNNRLYGATGADEIYSGFGDDFILAGDAGDHVEVLGGNNEIYLGSGNDYLETGAGNDIIDAGSGFDEVYGGAGDDYIHSVNGRNIFYGEAGNDKIKGGKDSDLIHGGDDNDILFGFDGLDRIFGENGDDIIYAGSGNDIIDGGDGNNQLYGGTGADIIYSGFGDDIVYSGVAGDYINIKGGNNTIYAGSGNDEIITGNGDDLIYGQEHSDIIISQSGSDIIYGGSGNDKINAGKDSDIIYGGEGNDIFIYENIKDSTSNNSDIIKDFEQGKDKIDISEIMLLTTKNDNNIFNNSDSNPLFETFEFSFENNNTIIANNENNFSIKLEGQHNLNESDFII